MSEDPKSSDRCPRLAWWRFWGLCAVVRHPGHRQRLGAITQCALDSNITTWKASKGDDNDMNRKRLKPVSAKRQKLNRLRRQAMHLHYGTNPACHAGPTLMRLGVYVCTGAAVDAHELVRRSRGGSIVDPDNVIPVCRPCHRWITEHPKEAARCGLDN